MSEMNLSVKCSHEANLRLYCIAQVSEPLPYIRQVLLVHRMNSTEPMFVLFIGDHIFGYGVILITFQYVGFNHATDLM